MEKIKVIFIAGAGRSGTTILSRVLGQIDGFFSAGELNWLWPSGYRIDQKCSCGDQLRECQVWRKVFELQFGEFTDEKIQELRNLTLEVSTRRNLFPLIFKFFRPKGFTAKLDLLRSYYVDMIKSIVEITGSTVIVDSSKDPSHALFLKGINNLDIYTVHVVRDIRAVAHSRKRIKRMVSENVRKNMPRQTIWMSSLKWSINNLMNKKIAFGKSYLFLKYEDFVKHPSEKVSEILRETGEVNKDLKFITENVIEVKPDHTALGNPNMTNSGILKLKEDDEWRHKMPKLKRLLITFMNFLLLRKYGYFE